MTLEDSSLMDAWMVAGDLTYLAAWILRTYRPLLNKQEVFLLEDYISDDEDLRHYAGVAD